MDINVDFLISNFTDMEIFLPTGKIGYINHIRKVANSNKLQSKGHLHSKYKYITNILE